MKAATLKSRLRHHASDWMVRFRLRAAYSNEAANAGEQVATTLDEESYQSVYGLVMSYLSSQPEITNRGLRKLSGITYDQAINFFRRVCAEGHLQRIGKSASTRYVRAKPS